MFNTLDKLTILRDFDDDKLYQHFPLNTNSKVMNCRLSWWTIWSWVRPRGLWSATNSEIWSRSYPLKTSKKEFHIHHFLFFAIYIWQCSGKVYNIKHSVSTYSSSESFKVVDVYPPSPTCDLWYFNLISTITHMWSLVLTHHQPHVIVDILI